MRGIAAVVVLASAGRLAAAPPVPREALSELVRRAQAEGAVAPRTSHLTIDLLAKAAPDECFDGAGNPYPPGPPCTAGVPKVNEAYVWGMAKDGRQLWFGTAPNVHCLVLGVYLGQTTPMETPSYVCEFGASPYAPPLPDALGDWRPAHIYRFDLASGRLDDVTPQDILLTLTVGMRSAGTHDGVVILGGPSFTGGINLFAWRTDTGAYLGSKNLPYGNIRKWVVAGNVLYTAAGNRVLRWRGSVADPFLLEEVGNLTGDGVELAVHAGRLFVSTWPPGVASLWMSPVIPAGGLTAAQAASWRRVWDASLYEPDPLTAATYGGGALASYGGWLYWGTMHVPMLAFAAHTAAYPPPDPAAALLAFAGTHRAIAIFRGRDFDTTPQVELLYGDATLPAYDPAAGWQIVPNRTGSPLLGGSGFGNTFNNYTWTMAVHQGELWVGTMDWSYLAGDLLGLPPGLLPYGADLYRFGSPADPAVAESTDGCGNYANYGLRTMLADDALYLGSANPMNLMTDLTDTLPEGGWELLLVWDPATRYVAGPGPGAGNANLVRLLDGGGALGLEWTAYGAGTFGTNVAAADVDGVTPEILTGPGPGPVMGPHVRAFRYDGSPLARVNFYAYGTLRYGVQVAGGDLDAAGASEIVTGAGPGAVFGPHVRAFRDDGQNVRPLPGASFYAYFSLRYGVAVAAADVDGAPSAEILTGPGPGPVFAPQVRGWDYAGAIAPIAAINAIVFPDPRYGCRVGAGDVDADGAAEGLFGPGPGAGLPMRMRGFELSGGVAPLPGLDVIPWPALSYGLDAVSGDLDGDGVIDPLAAQGPDPAATSRIRGYAWDGASLVPIGASDFDAFPGVGYGVRAATAILPR